MGQAPPSGLKEISRTWKQTEEGTALEIDTCIYTGVAFGALAVSQADS